MEALRTARIPDFSSDQENIGIGMNPEIFSINLRCDI